MNNGSFLGKGFGFPISVEPGTGRIRTAEYEEDIRQAIYLILMTRKGERVMRPEFGCGIHDFAFDSMDFGTLSQMEESVREALILWEPRIRDPETITGSGLRKKIIQVDLESYNDFIFLYVNSFYQLIYQYTLCGGIGI